MAPASRTGRRSGGHQRRRRDYAAIVLGLGGIGSGAAYWLSRRLGGDVLGLEQFELGHDRGESQDHSRIIRLSYHTLGYVTLAKVAYDAWSAVEADLGEQLILRTGGLDLWPAGAAIPMADYTASLAAAGVPFELLDAAETMRRWPQWRLADDTRVMFQADAGIAPAARCTAAHQKLARAHGATLLDQSPVRSVRPVDGEFEVTTPDAVFRCAKLIVAAGPWSNEALGHLGVRLPLTISREQVVYFATPRLGAFAAERFPIWIWMDDPSFYGFPVFGEQGTKIAQDCGGYETTADGRSFEPDPAGFERVRAFTEHHLPDALGPTISVKTCLYTLTPDRDFVIDTLPGQPAVSVAIGAGHAFKFASQIGRMLSELALDGSTDHDLAPFRIDRAALGRADPPRTFLV